MDLPFLRVLFEPGRRCKLFSACGYLHHCSLMLELNNTRACGIVVKYVWIQKTLFNGGMLLRLKQSRLTTDCEAIPSKTQCKPHSGLFLSQLSSDPICAPHGFYPVAMPPLLMLVTAWGAARNFLIHSADAY